ncbi:RING-CH-type domain-containing protein [Heracleum sosnowskyi]|uniref:RING-CH-type domain-containing protein n=1 Tax=Heracleum sosnowskyi TaxID=360622 RepID=A0AAD8M001_9APIA|nr:RING-CH-type domain-containing protein [Heracleum sosnowskyi]
MGSLEMTYLDIGCHCGFCTSAVSNENKDEIISFSETGEGSGGSNNGHASDSEVDQVSHSRRVSSAVDSDSEFNRVEIEYGVDEVRISFGTTERDCRICHLSLDEEPGKPFRIGCSCKNELASAHRLCAETWFRMKGNSICEICNSIAQNIIIIGVTESGQQISEANSFSTNAISPVSSNSERGELITFRQKIFSRSLNLVPYIITFIILIVLILKNGSNST